MKRTIINNGLIIKKNEYFTGSLIIEDSKIIEIKKDKYYPEGMDVNGAFIIPGIIDIHSDYLEKEISPRPVTFFPIDLAFRYLDYRALSSGITTLYNGISFRDEEGANRSIDLGLEVAKKMEEYVENKLFLINHCIHARLDTTTIQNLEIFDTIKDYNTLKMAVFNDHTPGIRQFRDLSKYANYTVDRSGLSRDRVFDEIELKVKKAKETEHIRPALAQKLKSHSIIMGSHDDTDLTHIDQAVKDGCTLTEFPTTLEAARYAKKSGLTVAMGATNLVLGKSQSGNISCRDAMKENLVDILCSDYHLPAILSSFCYLIENGYTYPNAINFISYNPAKLFNKENVVGSIDAGKTADIVILQIINKQPFVENVFVNGIMKFNCKYPVK